MNDIDKDTLAVAVHELGHAVVFREAGYRIGKIKVGLWLGGGFCDVEHPSPVFANEDEVREHCLGAVGGYVAEAHFRDLEGMSPPSRSFGLGSASDFAEFDRYASSIGLSETVACQEAHEIVLANWAEIMEYAPSLAVSGSMRGSALT